MVDVSSPDPDTDGIEQAAKDARAIVEELRLYDTDLYEKPRWLVLNKLDMVDNPEERKARICKALDWTGPVFSISALTGDGTQQLIWRLQDWLDADKRKSHLEQDKADGSYVAEDPRFDETRSDAAKSR